MTDHRLGMSSHRFETNTPRLDPLIPAWWKGLGADSEEKREPVSDIDTALVDTLKALDPNRPIREADMPSVPANVGFRVPHFADMRETHRCDHDWMMGFASAFALTRFGRTGRSTILPAIR